MKGQGGGGTAKGGGKSRSGGGNITIKKSKSMQTSAVDNSVLKLRAALFNDQGKDKDVTEGIAKSFLSYDRSGVAVDIYFSPKLSPQEVSWAFDLTRDNMEAIYENSGYGWDDDDKERELTEQGARFLLLRERQAKKLVGYIHFRFTVQGEVIDQMIGQPCVYILDMHIEEAFQRKGLGRHLLILMELIARREQMSRVSLPVYLHDDKLKNWINEKCKGYTIDVSFNNIGFDAEAEGFEVFSKIFVPKAAPVVESSAPTIAESSSSILPLPPTPSSIPLPLSLPTNVETTEEEVEVSVESVIEKLKECYIEEHEGQQADDETVSQWYDELERLQRLKENPDSTE